MQQDLLATYFLFVHIIISYTIYGIMSKRTLATARRTPDISYRRGLQLIAWFGVSLVLLFAFFIIDAIYQSSTKY